MAGRGSSATAAAHASPTGISPPTCHYHRRASAATTGSGSAPGGAHGARAGPRNHADGGGILARAPAVGRRSGREEVMFERCRAHKGATLGKAQDVFHLAAPKIVGASDGRSLQGTGPPAAWLGHFGCR